ncbi:hypothetical protein HYU19_00620 [Candidatus Woesearchaeota archaeon]|nr:hypothetical protein [Candidatus Woesearchaeota archaeon]
MAIEIDAVWKDGKILPLDNISLDNNTRVTIHLPEINRGEKKSLAGAWKDYKTKDGKSLDDVKKEIYDSRKISTRKETRL